MTRLEYFLEALRKGSYLYKAWIVEAFAITNPRVLPSDGLELYSTLSDNRKLHMEYRSPDDPDYLVCEQYPMELFISDGKVGYIDHATLEFTEVPEHTARHKAKRPLYSFSEVFNLPMGSLVNQTAACETTYGEILVNQTVKVYPFGTMFPFTPGAFNLKAFESILAPLVTSPPEDPNEPRDPNKVYGDVLEKRYFPAAFSISGLTMISVPAATPFTIDVDPAIRKLRDELIAKHKDELTNPVVVANIINQVVRLDMELQAKDPNGGFLQPGKSFDTVRAKMFVAQGIVPDFDDPSKFDLIMRSLSEQWDPKDLKTHVNAIVDASYSRGFDTALGGELAKILLRFFLTVRITTEDCGVKYARSYMVKKDNLDDFANCYGYINGKEELLTHESLKQYIGNVLNVRTPLYCKAPDGGFCVHCMGEEFRNRESQLAAHGTTVGEVLLYCMMKRSHGKALSTAIFRYQDIR